jgi:hypothetical protein
MKNLYFTLVAVLFFSATVFAGVSFHYTNKDSKAIILKVRIDGVYREITFAANKSAKIKVKGKETECLIVTSCGEVSIKDGDKFEIINGCIKKTKID